RMGSLATAKNEQGGWMAGGQWRHIEKFRTNGDTDYACVAKILGCLFKMDSGSRYPSANNLVGKPWHIVCLEDQRRNLSQDGGRHCRPRGVPANSNDNLRVKDAYDLSRMKDGRWKAEKSAQASYQADALEGPHFDQHQAKARLGHETRLNAPAGTD